LISEPPEKLSPELQVALFRSMLRIRLVEEAIAEAYPRQEMRCPVHLSIGQEAVAAGTAAALARSDLAMSGHRSHAHYLAKGGDLRAMMAEIMGRQDGCCRGRGGSMHLIDRSVGFMGAVPIVGSTIPIAVGLAFADKLRGQNRVTAAFLGEAATEEGVFHESANFASLHRLPVVFVCENNLYSVYSPMSVRQPSHREVFQQAQGHGIPAEQVDGNDPEAVFLSGKKARSGAASGKGPTFIEYKTYRWREHCGPGFDNHIGYREEKEFLEWKKKDPLETYRHKLTAAGRLTGSVVRDLSAAITAEIEAALAFARQSPPPRGLADFVYANSP
jgi:pyruvate dehydrogenase E1 component alpha subunit